MESLEEAVSKVRGLNIEDHPFALNEALKSNIWYSARYLAGKGLGVSDKFLSAKLDEWLDLLTFDLESVCNGYWQDCTLGIPRGVNIDTMPLYDLRFMPCQEGDNKGPDYKKIKMARRDLRCLYNIVDNREQKKEIGEMLGYNMWIREHPYATLNLISAGAAAAIILGYMIFQAGN
ncbi:MAG: hypothetical protein ABII01_01235 [Candidatus Woesearchaeota archaeon]